MNFKERLSKLKRDAASIGTSTATSSSTSTTTRTSAHDDDILISTGTISRGQKRSKTVETEASFPPKEKATITSSSSSGSTTLDTTTLPHDELKKVQTIYLVCPPNVQTGGPEAMHQLCDKINAWSEQYWTVESDGTQDNHDSSDTKKQDNHVQRQSSSCAVSAYMLYLQCHRRHPEEGARDTHCNHCKYAKPLDAYSIYSHVKVCHDWNEVVSTDKSTLVIWPECWTEYMTRNIIGTDNRMAGVRGSHPQHQHQHQHQQAIWWLSVDNNHGKFQDWYQRRDILHLYQSEYARQYIVNNIKKYDHDNGGASVATATTTTAAAAAATTTTTTTTAAATTTTQQQQQPSLILPMTEYIPYRHQIIQSKSDIHPSNLRDLEILYNPLKGLHYTDEIRKRSDKKFHFTPISGKHNRRLSPTEVVQLLKRAKVYIDFGNHPGMDRLPREAAMAGCIVITNKEGAAYYDEDVPIPSQYKIETFDVEKIHALLKKSIENYEERVHDFDAYREWISQQECKMESCVKGLLKSLVLERESMCE